MQVLFQTLAQENCKNEKDKDRSLVSLGICFKSTPLPKLTGVFAERKKQVTFSIAIENVELMHECSPEHLRKGTVRLK